VIKAYHFPFKGSSYVHSLVACLESLIVCSQPCIVAGDFNLPKINWKLNTGPDGDIYGPILDFININGFTQAVDFPTRDTNILDIVMSNDELLITDCVAAAPFGSSDHTVVRFCLPNGGLNDAEPTAPYVIKADFQRANFTEMNAYLNSIDWQAVLANVHDVDVMWSYFTDIIDYTISVFVPNRTIKVKHSADYKHYPRHVRQLFNKQLAAWRLYRRFRTISLKQKYSELQNKCKIAVNNYVKDTEDRIINNNNLGDFYKYVNNKIVNKSGISALKNADGQIVADDKAKADLLCEYFSSVFTVDNNCLPCIDAESCNSGNMQPTFHDDILEDIDFNIHSILKTLLQLKPKMSSGPDGYSSFLLKNVATSIAFPLSLIFSESFCEGQVPYVWKQAIVTPSFKKGSPCDPGNYRPISLTCVCCKVMETVIKDQLLAFLLRNSKITKQQHGFLSKHSTCSQLIECLHDWTMALNAKNSVHAAYIDFSKAFDSVVHSKLLYKLKMCGIRGKLLLWVAAFLSNRTQYVKVGSVYSDTAQVISGVPQGCVLGPVLFLLYINDIVMNFDQRITLKLFADDVKIYVVINDLDDCILLQRGLDRIVHWADTWQLSISITKSAVIHFGNNNKLAYSYAIGDSVLPTVDNIRDLGVTVDCKLRFNIHINN